MTKKEVLKVVNLLKKRGVKVCGTTDEFYGYDAKIGFPVREYDLEDPEFKLPENWRGGIWCDGEDNQDLFNYWAIDPQEKHYIFGVNKKLYNQLDKLGWYMEWNDAGTIMCYPN